MLTSGEINKPYGCGCSLPSGAVFIKDTFSQLPYAV
jgi:hypothetical protein